MEEIMWTLPDCTTVVVLSYLSLSNLASFSLVCKYIRSVTLSKELMQVLFERDLFLPISYFLPSGEYDIPFSTQCRLLKSVHTMTSTYIDFIGFATNGGIDEDNPLFWLRRVFMKDNRSYCTQENAFNVNVAGVLGETQKRISQQEIVEVIKERLNCVATNLGRSGRRIREIIDDPEKLQKVGFLVVSEIAEEAPHLLLHPEEPLKTMWTSVTEVLKATVSRAINFDPLVRKTGNHLVLEEQVNKVSFPECGQVAFVKGMKVSREGGFTCPVGVLMFFSSLNYIDVEDPIFEVYNNLKTVRDVESLVEANSAVPRIYSSILEEDHYQIEFRGNSSHRLQPILWLSFTSETGQPKKLSLHCSQSFPSVYLYMKLIAPEDRRVERHWEHEFLNIDIRYAVARGEVFNVEVEKR